MKKFIAAVILTALSVAVLFGCAENEENADYAYYFRDNTAYAAENILICLIESPYAHSRGFEKDVLLRQGVLPELDGFNNFSCSGMYYEDGGIYEITCYWQNYDEENLDDYKQLQLTIVPCDAEDLYTRDGAVVPAETGNTETVVNGITVIGVGTPEKTLIGEMEFCNNCLIFEKDGMHYQIEGTHQTSLEDMGQVLEFYLENDIDFDVFAMENGDKYEHQRLSEYPDAFPGCIPDESGLPLTRGSDSLTLKNGEAYSAYLDFEYLDDSMENPGRIWFVVEPDDGEEDIPQLHELTEAELISAMDAEGEVEFLVDGMRVEASMNMDDMKELLLLLLRTLPDYPKEDAETEPSGYFRDNTGQTGTFHYAFCGVGKDGYQMRYFIDRWGTLLRNDVIPAIMGTPLEALCGYYDAEDQLCLVYMEFGDTWVYIYPPGTELWDSWYECAPEACTETVINGVSVYGDGVLDGQEKALFFETADGAKVYIVGENGADGAVMTALAEHFAKYGVDLDAFGIKNGDHYEYVTLEDPRAVEFLKYCYPDTEDILMINVEIKNGSIQRAVVNYEVLPGRSIIWTVLPDCPMDVTVGLRDIPDLTLEDLEAYLNEADSTAVTYVNGKFIKIHMQDDGLADELWEMIRLLQ